MRTTFYIETSVWNFLLVEDRPERTKITERFFEQAAPDSLYISELVFEEVGKAPETILKRLSKEIERFKPLLLPVSEDARRLAGEYVSREIFPAKYYDDALHVAYACYYDLDVILSWNFKHIVRLKTKKEVKAANIILGFHTPDIVSPEEIAYGL
jgi:predicted nucleic acid-binding protein